MGLGAMCRLCERERESEREREREREGERERERQTEKHHQQRVPNMKMKKVCMHE